MQTNGLTKTQITTMTVTAGICVANIYYNQPLLHDMAKSLGTTDAKIGNIAVLTQSGYGLGLFFLTPLGDKLRRKNIILTLQLLLIAALIGLAFASQLWIACILSLLIGMMATAAQVILPMAASLSPAHQKGKIVGIIFTGILTGILAARVFSGYIAGVFNWRYVYGIAAGMVTVSMILSFFILPDPASTAFTGSYAKLLASVLVQVKRFTLLRQTALLGALVFGAFCSFWTTLTFHLSGAPFHYGTDKIGLFGLLAIVSALLAPVFGKLADKRAPERSLMLTTALIIIGVACLQAFPVALWALVAAVLLLDIGVQASQVTNVALIYTLDETAHSRINTVYMTSYFIGGALGTFVGVQCWNIGGWPLVTIQLLIWGLLAFLLAAFRYQRNRRAGAVAG